MEPRSAAAAAASAAAIPAESAPPLQSHPEKGVSAPGKGTAAKGARGGQSRCCSVVAARLPRRAPWSSTRRGRPELDSATNGTKQQGDLPAQSAAAAAAAAEASFPRGPQSPAPPAPGRPSAQPPR